MEEHTQGSHVEAGIVEHPNAEDFGHARTLPTDTKLFFIALFFDFVLLAL
jgi:maltose alpha-D-glucosyltransferase/alpha-amylase